MSRKMDSQRVARTKYLAFRKTMREYLRAAYEQTDSLDMMTRRATAVFINVEGWTAYLYKVNNSLNSSFRMYGISDPQESRWPFFGVVAQLPFVLRNNEPMSDEVVGWTRLMVPKQPGWGHAPEGQRLRCTLAELAMMVDAGVPLWMAERFDVPGEVYPAEIVTEAFLNSYPDEFVWALIGTEPTS